MNIYFTILLMVVMIIVLLLLGFAILVFSVKKRDLNKTKDDIIKFMEKNPDMWSLSVIQNDKEVAHYNKDKIIPLASTVKILYAIAFMNAVRNHAINADEIIPIKEVDALYLPNTDGNAYNLWKENEQIGSEVTLKEIAMGMMKYSSNACTDFLYYKLGEDKIEEVIKEYSLRQHTEIYPLNGALLIPIYLYMQEKVAKKDISKTMKEMPMREFNLLATEMLNNMIIGEVTRYIENLNLISATEIQRELSIKLPAATSMEYAKLMYELGNSKNLTAEDKQLMDDLMGYSDYKESRSRFWYKGGSTLFILTSAGYRSNDSETLSFAFFIEDMNALETNWIKNKYNEFIKAFLDDHLFRTKVLNVVDELNHEKV